MELAEEALRSPDGNGEYRVLCAVDGSRRLTGYICFGPIPMTDDRYDLYWIATDRSRSRQGVGEKLLQAVVALVAAKKGVRIYVETSSTPAYRAARAFYRKQGFHLACVLDDFYREGDHKMIYLRDL